jgi:hypothetical protein
MPVGQTKPACLYRSARRRGGVAGGGAQNGEDIPIWRSQCPRG